MLDRQGEDAAPALTVLVYINPNQKRTLLINRFAVRAIDSGRVRTSGPLVPRSSWGRR
ncbi:hypothetical protein [Streptomyces sp. NPDC055749]